MRNQKMRKRENEKMSNRQYHAKVVLTALLIAVLTGCFLAAAQDTIWSSIAMDTVISTTASGVYVEIVPTSAAVLGQVNVTIKIYNVVRLYCWQMVLASIATVNVTATTVPAENIFQGYDTLGLIATPIETGAALGNCLLGQVVGASGNGTLAQVAFQVSLLPTTFKINPDPRNSFLLDDELNEIPFTFAAGSST
jgi:hypothetical protein